MLNRISHVRNHEGVTQLLDAKRSLPRICHST